MTLQAIHFSLMDAKESNKSLEKGYLHTEAMRRVNSFRSLPGRKVPEMSVFSWL